MIYSLLIIHNHYRMSSITRVLHPTTWDYFSSSLPDHFIRSPKVMKEVIMTSINDLVQEFWSTSSDRDVGASFFAMRRLFEILQRCFDYLEVCFDIVSVLATAVDLADKNPQMPEYEDVDDGIGAKFKILLDGYRKMFDQSFSKSKDLDDTLRFLPGVVVQNRMTMQGMAVLYRIKPDLLENLIKSTIGPLKLYDKSRYEFDDYLSGLLQDRDRSQLYYCDPMLQHIYICRHFLSLLDRSNAFDFQS